MESIKSPTDAIKAMEDSTVPQIAIALCLLLRFARAIMPNISPTIPNTPPKQMDVIKENIPMHNDTMENAVAKEDGCAVWEALYVDETATG